MDNMLGVNDPDFQFPLKEESSVEMCGVINRILWKLKVVPEGVCVCNPDNYGDFYGDVHQLCKLQLELNKTQQKLDDPNIYTRYNSTKSSSMSKLQYDIIKICIDRQICILLNKRAVLRYERFVNEVPNYMLGLFLLNIKLFQEDEQNIPIELICEIILQTVNVDNEEQYESRELWDILKSDNFRYHCIELFKNINENDLFYL